MVRNEILLNELGAERLHSNEQNERFIAETRGLKTRVQMLEQWLESVNGFIGRNASNQNDDIDDFPEDRDVFDDMFLVHRNMNDTLPAPPEEVAWSDGLSPRHSPRSPRSPRGALRLSFGVSGPLVSSGRWDMDEEDEDDAKRFAKMKSPLLGKHAIVNHSPEHENQGGELTSPHKSSLRKLFPLPAALSGDLEMAYKNAPVENRRIDVANTSGKKRIETVYDNLMNKPSVSFMRIKFGLKALKTSLQHSINEESLLRNYLVTVAEQNYSSAHNNDRTINKISKNVDYLQNKVDELELSRDDAIQVCGELRARIDELTQDLDDAQRRYADTVVAAEVTTANYEALKSENVVLHAKYDSMQLDYDNLFYDRNNMVLNTKKLNLKINETQLSNDLLQGKLDQVMQRLSVTIVQRDELVRQFIDNDHFDGDELEVDILGTGDVNYTHVDSDVEESDDHDSITINSSQRLHRRNSSFRSDNSGRFIPWS